MSSERPEPPESLSDATGLPEYDPELHTIEVTTDQQMQLVRKWAERRLTEAGLSRALTDDALFILSELANNVVETDIQKAPEEHRQAKVGVVIAGREVELSVSNSLTYYPPERREAVVEQLHNKLTGESRYDVTSERGRGLWMVKDFASDWGGEPDVVLLPNGEMLASVTLYESEPATTEEGSTDSHQVA